MHLLPLLLLLLLSPTTFSLSVNPTKLSSQSTKAFRTTMSPNRVDPTATTPIRTVMKFGGSSLADASRIDYVAKLIKSQIEKGIRPQAMVCSAMGKTTNNLLNAGDAALTMSSCNVDAIRTLHMNVIEEFQLPNSTKVEIDGLLRELEALLMGVNMLKELSPRSLDMLVSYGERMSVRIMSARLNQLGVPAVAVDAWNVGFMTNGDFGDAALLDSSEASIREAFSSKIDPQTVAVVTGFIGHDAMGRITTLGRGGSDLTATAIGAACDLDEIIVWKDVDGILSTDPRMVPAAIPIPSVSFDEAAELAYFGAKVLHPIAMMPAMKKGVTVRVKNSYNTDHPGTVINAKGGGNLVTALTCKRDVQLIDIKSTRMLGAYGFLANVFKSFDKHKLSVDVLASSEVSVSLTLDSKNKVYKGHGLCDDLKDVADIVVEDGRAILTLIADVARSSEVLATAFRVFYEEDIHVEMLSQGASKVNISFIVADKDLEKAMTTLHKCFFEGGCGLKEEGAKEVE